MNCPKNLTRLCGSFLRSLAKMQRQRNFLFTPWLSMCQSWTQTWDSIPPLSLSAGNFNTYNTRQLKLRARFDKLSKLSAKIWHLTKKKREREREKFPEKIEYTRGWDWGAKKVRAKQRWTVNGRQAMGAGQGHPLARAPYCFYWPAPQLSCFTVVSDSPWGKKEKKNVERFA